MTAFWVGVGAAGLAVAVLAAVGLVQHHQAHAATPPGWEVDDVLRSITAELRAIPANEDPTIAIPAGGRHRVVADRAADHVQTRTGHVPRHSLDTRVPAAVRDVVAGLDVVDRARALAWSLGRAAWDPPAPPPQWARRAQLELRARLRQMGVRPAHVLP